MIGTEKHLEPKKSLGQHFLHDASIITKILDAVAWNSAKYIVEIGPGRGALTAPMYAMLEACGRAKDLILVELDADLLPSLHERFPLATIVHADATQVHWRKIVSGESWIVVSNLPYNAGTAIVNDIFWGDHPPVSAVVMLQKEVGERILAHPPRMGMLGVAMQLKVTGTVVCRVKSGAFTPPPKVESIVLLLIAHQKISQEISDRIVQCAKRGFAHPRKQLRQTLAQAGMGDKEFLGNILVAQGLSALARPEELSLSAWEALVT